AVLLGLLVLVLVVVLVAGLVWPGFWRAEGTPQPVPTVTVTAPAPTPTVKAIERSRDGTDFQQALPSAVLRYALGARDEAAEPTGKAIGRACYETVFQQALPTAVLRYALGALEEADEPKEQGALEALSARYADGGSDEIELVAGQWATDDEAATAAAAWPKAAGEAEHEGDVKVGRTARPCCRPPVRPTSWRTSTPRSRSDRPRERMTA